MQRKRLEDMNLLDDFLFNAVMTFLVLVRGFAGCCCRWCWGVRSGGCGLLRRGLRWPG